MMVSLLWNPGKKKEAIVNKNKEKKNEKKISYG